MDLFALLGEFAPEEFYVIRRRELGLTAFLALDDTRLGPAAGGIRWRVYATPEEGAHDVLRLARAMTYKNAFAEIDLGGGKTVVLRDSLMDAARAFPALGDVIQSLGGRYITACDYGTTAAELALVKSRTAFALAEDMSGALDVGTATGVLVAIRAAWRRASGAESLADVRVLVQGVGDVGYLLVRLLCEAGARVAFSEVDEERAERCRQEFGVTRVPADGALAAPMDVFAPCAAGEIVTEEVARTIAARAIAGAANNQLASERAGAILAERGICYAPDFAANAGAVIVGFESGVGRAATALATVAKIEERLERVFTYADQHEVTTTEAALHFARKRLEQAKASPRR